MNDFGSSIHTDQDILHRLHQSSWSAVWKKTKKAFMGYAAVFGVGILSALAFSQSYFSANVDAGFLSFFLSVFLLPASLGLAMAHLGPSWLSYMYFSSTREKNTTVLHKFLKDNKSDTTLSPTYYFSIDQAYALSNIIGHPDDLFVLPEGGGRTVMRHGGPLQYLCLVPQEYLHAMARDPEVAKQASQAWGKDWLRQPIREANKRWLEKLVPDLDARVQAVRNEVMVENVSIQAPQVDDFVLVLPQNNHKLSAVAPKSN